MNRYQAGTEECIEFFNSQAQRWLELYERKPEFRDRQALFINSLTERLPALGKVLDFGCGPGVMCLTLARMGYQVTGIDAAPKMIDIAEQQRVRSGLSNLAFSVMQAKSFSLEPASYDAVICSSVLEYLKDDLGLLADLAMVLRPRGVLLVSVPHAASLPGSVEHFLARFVHGGGNSRRLDMRYSSRRYDVNKFLADLRALSFGSFECKFFEMPLLGRLGIGLSRFRRLGVMVLVSAVKENSHITWSKQQE